MLEWYFNALGCRLTFYRTGKKTARLNEHRTRYFTANILFDQLVLAKADGSYFKEIDTIAQQKLLMTGMEKSYHHHIANPC
ncbi:hypothetical protein [Marinilabilia sp.]|uniref:hypothetical protein n=1 Tax=Marinilabilia sp. TaxID=2021252 RepID=UPI0025C2A70B|nr:hypothetical protein [Marinilabilia sp.]